MTRINVYSTNDDYLDDGQRTLDGWFNDDTAERFNEDTHWDGSNHISLPTGSQWNHEALYHTAGGRWVLHWWSQWQGSEESYRFVGEDAAREWLLMNGHDEAVAAHFGAVEPERAPGRPEVGQAINVRLGDELLLRVDAYSASLDISRAEAIRRLVNAGLVSA